MTETFIDRRSEIISRTAQKCGWPIEIIEKEINITEDLLRVLDAADEIWITIPSSEILLTLLPFLAKGYEQVFEDATQWHRILQHINSGSTFLFTWKNNFLQIDF